MGNEFVKNVQIFAESIGVKTTTIDSSAGLTVGRNDSNAEGGQITLRRANDNGNSYAIDVYGTGSSPNLRIVDFSAGSPRFQIDSLGRVVIGPGTSSGANFEVAQTVNGGSIISKVSNPGTAVSTAARYDLATGSSNSYTTFSLTEYGTGSSYTEWVAGPAVTGGTYITSATTASPIVLRQGASERLRISSTGNIGIGTSGPTAKFQVNNTSPSGIAIGMCLRNDSNNAGTGVALDLNPTSDGLAGERSAQIVGLRDTTANNIGMAFRTSVSDLPAERARITPDGNLGISTTTPNERITVVGNISATGTIYASSIAGGGQVVNFVENYSHVGGVFSRGNDEVIVWGNWPCIDHNDTIWPPAPVPFFSKDHSPSATIKKIKAAGTQMLMLMTDGNLYVCGNPTKWDPSLTCATGYTQAWVRVRSDVVEFDANIDNSTAELTIGVITNSGQLLMWGRNGAGQCGTGTTTPSFYSTPQTVSTAGKIPSKVSIQGSADQSAVGSNTFVLMTDGTIYSTGYNAGGQLGVGDTSNRTTLTQCKINSTTFMTGVSAIVEQGANWAGGWTRYIIKTDGTMWATGYNNTGQLGTGDTIGTNSSYFKQCNFGTTVSVRKAVVLGSGDRGGVAVCVLTTAGTVYTWGINGTGVSGTGNTTTNNLPQLVSLWQFSQTATSSLPAIVDISTSGNYHGSYGSFGLLAADGTAFLSGRGIFTIPTFWQNTNGDSFYNRFEKSPILNTKFICYAQGNTSDPYQYAETMYAIDTLNRVWAWGNSSNYITGATGNYVRSRPANITAAIQ